MRLGIKSSLYSQQQPGHINMASHTPINSHARAKLSGQSGHLYSHGGNAYSVCEQSSVVEVRKGGEGTSFRLNLGIRKLCLGCQGQSKQQHLGYLSQRGKTLSQRSACTELLLHSQCTRHQSFDAHHVIGTSVLPGCAGALLAFC